MRGPVALTELAGQAIGRRNADRRNGGGVLCCRDRDLQI
jgi:hypothetical protein